MSRVILDGDPKGEYCWADVRSDSVTFGLHMLRVTSVDLVFVDRTMLTVPRRVLEDLLRETT